MGFFLFLMMIAVIWLLWNICRNTNDALDKQTAIQYEIVSLEKRVEELLEKLEAQEKGSTTTKKIEPPAVDSSPTSGLADSSERINVNTATEARLTDLPKVGHAMAKRIIDGRPYQSKGDLLKIKGLSEEMISHFEDQITY